MAARGTGELAETARRWALAMTRQRSVTGTAGEARFGPWLAAELGRDPAFTGQTEIWAFPVAPGDGRHCVAMLARGSGRQTVILTGHYDTVTVDDYGDLAELATEPEPLTEALRRRLAEKAVTPAEQRARDDFAGGDFLAGRGLLDMKAGLAAGLAVIAAFLGKTERRGNLLFLAVPDEENNSAGARAAAPELARIAKSRGLGFAAAVNLDAIADDGDGTQGRVVALGTVGKLLPTLFVAGVPTHGGFPLNGLNGGALAAAVAARVEWAPELTDAVEVGQPGTPPSLLSLRDGKRGYDVTTPAFAFAAFNVLSYRRAPAEVLDRFDALCGQAGAAHLASLKARAGAAGPAGDAVPVWRFETVLAAALAADPANAETLQDTGRHLAQGGGPLPEQCRLLTEQAWRLSGLPAPAIITGFGSIPYLSASLSETPAARRLRAAAERLAAESQARFGEAIACTSFFAGISDVSFWGEADEAGLGVVARNTPAWEASVGWPERGGIAGIPTLNAGPWGRDYHTPLERLHMPYAFDVLPRFLADLADAVLAKDAEGDPAG